MWLLAELKRAEILVKALTKYESKTKPIRSDLIKLKDKLEKYRNAFHQEFSQNKINQLYGTFTQQALENKKEELYSLLEINTKVSNDLKMRKIVFDYFKKLIESKALDGMISQTGNADILLKKAIFISELIGITKLGGKGKKAGKAGKDYLNKRRKQKTRNRKRGKSIGAGSTASIAALIRQLLGTTWIRNLLLMALVYLLCLLKEKFQASIEEALKKYGMEIVNKVVR